MKKVVSTLILGITFPIRLLKRTKIDNFVGGLIFGAFFSLIVNIVTVQIQEAVNKQRALESVENEIVNNMIIANTIYDSRVKDINERTPINLYYAPTKYSSDVWRQSSEAIGYISQLDSNIQIKVMLYYSMSVPFANTSASKSEDFANMAIDMCLSKDLTYQPKDENDCVTKTLVAYSSDKFAAETMSKDGLAVLNVFHPTKDRLNNWFLRLLMGNKSTRILSGK